MDELELTPRIGSPLEVITAKRERQRTKKRDKGEVQRRETKERERQRRETEERDRGERDRNAILFVPGVEEQT